MPTILSFPVLTLYTRTCIYKSAQRVNSEYLFGKQFFYSAAARHVQISYFYCSCSVVSRKSNLVVRFTALGEIINQ